MSDTLAIVDGLDLVVALAEGQVPTDQVEAARRTALQMRHRPGFPGATLVVALVGGTGSGKSSLLNALAGERVASVGTVRPHTSVPLAWIPEAGEPAVRELLDRLSVSRRVTQRRFPGLALIDMTDVDSVEMTHRATVEALLPEVDGVIWVLDPSKYAEPVLHDEFVRRLCDSADQFVFALNQVDRVPAADLPRVVDDLVRLLGEDGIEDPVVFPVAADPPGADPIGVDALAAHLAARFDAKWMRRGRMLAETRRATRELADAAGLRRGGSLSFEERWGEVAEGAATALSLGGPGRGILEEVLCSLEDLVGRIAAEAGGPFGARIRAAFTPAVLEAMLREAVTAMEAKAPRLAGPHTPVDPEQRAAAADILEQELQNRLGAPMRTIIWERASLAASLAGLTVDVTKAEAAMRRAAGRDGRA
jgi:energy-coupling factor transporter ATP-binding protein EcfA2